MATSPSLSPKKNDGAPNFARPRSDHCRRKPSSGHPLAVNLRRRTSARIWSASRLWYCKQICGFYDGRAPFSR
uniref:Uncharacterized protein n=1 Tax=Oryza barthii TaxID=65489 RepID=A0A0D3EJJ0_9ORYZ